MKPFFSVVIPAYNRAYILPRTIQSVMNQSFSNWELIVVDDGSKDNTREVVSSIKDERIRYVYQNNAERSAARNHGARLSAGTYICFLDSDDEFLPEHLQRFYDLITRENMPVGLLFCDCFVQDEEGARTLNHDVPRGTDPWHLFFLKNSVIPARVCVHRAIFDSVKFREDIVIVEDTVLWTTIALRYPVYHLETPGILYHWHDDNSVNLLKNCFLPRLKGFKKMFEDDSVARHIPTQIKRYLLSNCYYGIARHYELTSNFRMALLNITKSILIWPSSPQTKAKLFLLYTMLFKKKQKQQTQIG